MKDILKKIAGQGIIVILLLGVIWLFKVLPGWIIEQELEKALSRVQPVPDIRQTAKGPLASEKKNTRTAQAKPISEEQVYRMLKHVKDPELDINIVDLGLIRNIRENDKGITVTMILTTRFCPYQGEIVSAVKAAVRKVSQGQGVNVVVDFSETWTPSDLTADGKKQWEKIFGRRE